MADVVIRGMEMPSSCDMCWALDDCGDYPRCRITEEQRGYNFQIREKRMDKCPLIFAQEAQEQKEQAPPQPDAEVMKEYVEREAAVKAAKDGADEWDGGCSRYRDASIESAMNAIPSADVVEVSAIHDAVYEAMQVLNSIYSANRIGNADYMDLMGAISLIFSNCGTRMDGGADSGGA